MTAEDLARLMRKASNAWRRRKKYPLRRAWDKETEDYRAHLLHVAAAVLDALGAADVPVVVEGKT